MTFAADLHDLHRAVDEQHYADLRTEARELAADAYWCAVCGGPDADGTGECRGCHLDADDLYRREVDR